VTRELERLSEGEGVSDKALKRSWSSMYGAHCPSHEGGLKGRLKEGLKGGLKGWL
jgi:hypothetical protein